MLGLLDAAAGEVCHTCKGGKYCSLTMVEGKKKLLLRK